LAVIDFSRVHDFDARGIERIVGRFSGTAEDQLVSDRP